MKYCLLSGVFALLLLPGMAAAQTPAPEPSPAASLASPAPATPAAPAASVAPVAPTATPAAPTPSADTDEQQLLTIEQEWCTARLHGDAEYLERLLGEDYVFTGGDRAEPGNKARELQETRDRAVHYTVIENRDMTVHLHGDAAVVTGRSRLKGTTAATGKPLDAEEQFTHVFARIDGHWRAVAAHMTRVGG